MSPLTIFEVSRIKAWRRTGSVPVDAVDRGSWNGHFKKLWICFLKVFRLFSNRNLFTSHYQVTDDQDLWKSLYKQKVNIWNWISHIWTLKTEMSTESQNSKGKIFQQIEKRLQTPICYFKSSCEPNIVCPTVERTLAFNKRSKVCLIFNRWVFTVGATELRLLITPGLLFSRSLQNSKQIIHHQTDLSKVKVYLYLKASAD